MKTALFTTRYLISLSLGVATITGGLLLSQHLVSAQQSSTVPNQITLTAMPPRLGDDGSLTAKPGEKIQASVRVRNSSSEKIQISTSAQDFITDNAGDTPIPLMGETDNRWSLAKWMVITPQVQVLEPNEVGLVNVIIEVPKDGLPGGHYAMITHQPAVANDRGQFSVTTTDSASRVNQRVGTLVYLRVEGPINEEAFVRQLNFPKFSEFGPVPFSFTIDNQSDIHISPQIGVEIYNIFGRKIDTISIESKNIFPMVSRSFENEWHRIWGFGFYKARVVMSYGESGQISIANTSFWLLPVKLLLAVLVVLMVILVISISVRRHLLHRADDKQRRINELEKKLQEIKDNNPVM